MNYKIALLSKTRKIIALLVKVATQADRLAEVLSRNNSLIIADVDFDKVIDFRDRYYELTGKELNKEDESQIVVRDPNNLRKGKKQLRIFFNASPKDVQFLESNDIFPKKSKGSAATKAAPMAKEFDFVINDTAMLHELLIDPSFHLGLNVNYNDRLHPGEEELNWEQEYHKIQEQLQSATDEQQIDQLKEEKRQILEVLRRLEENRLGN